MDTPTETPPKEPPNDCTNRRLAGEAAGRVTLGKRSVKALRAADGSVRYSHGRTWRSAGRKTAETFKPAV